MLAPAAESGAAVVKILIVDDEAHIRQMMRLTLEAAGYEVDEAADGQAGLARFADGRSGPPCCSIRRCRDSTAWRRCGS